MNAPFTSAERDIYAKVLDEIARDAVHIAELASRACADGGDDNLDRAIEIVAQKIGMTADFALKRAGGTGHNGGAEGWMFPTGLQELLRGEASGVEG